MTSTTNSAGIEIPAATSRETDNSSSVGVVYEHLLTEDEAIQQLGLKDRSNPKSSLRWLTRTKRLSFVRIGRGIHRFRPTDIRSFIEAHHEPAK